MIKMDTMWGVQLNITEEVVCKMLLILYNIVAILFILFTGGRYPLSKPSESYKDGEER